MRRILLPILMVAAALLQAAGSWTEFVREESARTGRDDRIFATLDRRLKALAEASPEEAPAFRLLAARTLEEARWQFDRGDAAGLPEPGTPSQTWTFAQAEALAESLNARILDDAALYARLPGAPFAALGRDSRTFPGVTALGLLAEAPAFDRPDAAARLLAAAEAAGDTVAAGLIRLRQAAALPTPEERVAACEDALRDPMLDGELRARFLLLWVESLPHEDATAARRADLLNEALRTASVHDTCAALRNALNRILRSEIRLDGLPEILPPGPLSLPLKYRNTGTLRIVFAGALNHTETVRLPETEQLHGWGETTLALPTLPCGEVTLTLTPECRLGESAKPFTHTFRVATFSVARLTDAPLAVAVADTRTDLPLPDARVTWRGHSVVTDADGIACFPALPLPEGRQDVWPLRVEARGETLTVEQQPARPRTADADARRYLCVTDRSLYRPGDTVRWELIVCGSDGRGSPRPAAGESVTVVWSGRSPSGADFRTEAQATASEAGSVSGEFTLSPDFTGTVSALVGKRWGGTSVTVAAFRPPELAVEAEAATRGVAFGDPVKVSGAVTDLSGVPIGGARVVWALGGQDACGGETVTAADGSYAFEVVPETDATEGDTLWTALSLSVTAPNGDGTDRNLPLVIRRYGYELTLDVPEWIEAGKPFGVGLAAERPLRGTLRAIGDGREKPVLEIPFCLTDTSRPLELPLTLPAGLYRLEAESADGNVTAYGTASVLPADGNLDGFPDFTALLTLREPGDRACAVGETVRGFAAVRGNAPAMLAAIGRGGLVSVTPLTSPFFELPVTEALAGGFTLAVYGFDRGRFCSSRMDVQTRPSAPLRLELVRFPARTAPGMPQVWELAVDDPSAEVVLTCYDAALDTLSPYDWKDVTLPAEGYYGPWALMRAYFGYGRDWWGEPLPRDFIRGPGRGVATARMAAANVSDAVLAESAPVPKMAASGRAVAVGKRDGAGEATPPEPRTDFARTALWAPQRRLVDGRAVYTFTLPDSLTTWKVMAFAHTPDGRSGTLTKTVVAAKELMLRPYLPRALRTGDRVTVTVQVANATDAPLETWVELDGAERRTLTLPARGSQPVSWEIASPAEPGLRTFDFTAPGDAVRIEVPVLDTRVAVEDVYPVTLADTAPQTVRVATPVPGAEIGWDLSGDPMKAVLDALTPLLTPESDGTDAAFARVAAMALLQRAGSDQPGLGGAVTDLLSRRTEEGLWPWFPGGKGDPCISADIAVGVARLRLLGAAPAPLVEAVADLVARQESALPFAAGLYVRSVLADRLPAGGDLAGRAAAFLRDGRGDIQEDRMVTVAALRLGFDVAAKAGRARVTETMNRSPVWGTWWPQERLWWRWWGTPLGSHVLGYEVLKASGESEAARGAALWLLQHRRLNGWGPGRDTLAAVYALLAEGLAPESPAPEIRVTRAVAPEATELTFARAEPGFTFGRVTASYRADISELPPPADADPDAALTLDVQSDPASGAAVGDTVRVTVTLHAAQPMQYVRVEVPRPANAEPLRQTPGWDFASGAYCEPGDTGTVFWLPQLRRGYTVLRYDLRVTHAGSCALAPASAALLHAPDVAARTGGGRFETR